MKKLLMISIIILFFIICVDYSFINKNTAYAKFNNEIKIELFIDEKKYIVDNNKNLEIKLTDYQIKNINNYELKIEQIDKMKNMGFDSEQIIKYLYPYLYFKIIEVLKNEEVEPVNAKLCSEENSAKVYIKNEKYGVKLNKNIIFNNILHNLCNKYYIVNIEKDIKKPQICSIDLQKCLNLRGIFVTKFKNSTNERKNNIKIALNSLNGCVIDSEEVFSFNNVVGIRNEENGYKSAKIISNGKFIDSIGGGVCQVSTTLYNAALLSGLDIIEVNSHSLKIGYVEPGFDSMVNMGSSDLKFKNNTGHPLIISTSNKDDNCTIAIYGIENNYKYERVFDSEYIDIPCDIDNVLQPASEVYTKLLVYKDGVLVEEKNLRKVRYNQRLKDIQ